ATPAASTTRAVASATSGPIPSPGIKVILCATYRSIRTRDSRSVRSHLNSDTSMSFRLRTGKGKLKIEHSILENLRPVLDRLVLRDDIRSIIPGVIRPVRDAKGPVKIRITVPTLNGWKAIALATGAGQELFISTERTEPQLTQALQEAIEA